MPVTSESPLTTGSHGTPLVLIDSLHFSEWLSEQHDALQNWLQNSDYKGEGLALVAGANGKLEQVIFGTDNVDDYFLLGELASTLPAGDYQLQGGNIELDEARLQAAAFSWAIGSYRFDPYKTEQEDTPSFAHLVLPEGFSLQLPQDIAAAISQARDLINTPANDMMPEQLANTVKTIATSYGAQFEQIVGDDLLTENYPAIHAVGRASVHAPRLIDLRWGDPSHPKVTLVGKGICFDSGGLNLKPTASIRLMKKDMAGSAHAIGLAQLIMASKLPVQLRLLVPAAENAVSGNAFRPGDVITTRKGLTVEIDNTDAEGRLVLCDALAEAASEGPELIIDFATLTGACKIALGTEIPGLFCNNPETAQQLMSIGDRIDDPVWSMPLYQPYWRHLKSDIADMVNTPSSPLAGGAICAGLFLQRFVGEDSSWMHFDFMAWNDHHRPGRPVGGDTVALRTVFEYLRTRFQ